MLDARGRLLGSARRAITTRTPGDRAEQDPLAWLAALVDAGREAAAGQTIDVVAVCALGPAPILVDRELAPLTPALLFSLDRRAEEERFRLGVTHDHALPKLLWWRAHRPEIARDAAFAIDATGFLVARLTGAVVMDGITHGDYHHEEPSPFPLPGLRDPCDIAGGLTADAATSLGLREGTPVAVGTYDTFGDVAAAGVLGPGDAGVILGSTVIIGYACAEPAPQCPGLARSRYVGEGILVGGWTASGGAAIDWCERELGAADVADREPGSGGLVFLPYLAGERTPVWDPAARGVLVGVTLETRRQDICRAIVDGVALSTRDHAERLRDSGLAPHAWRISGGGTRNTAWLGATCDALGTPLELVAHAGEAVGAAVLALRAAGADVALPVEREIVPDAARTERFEALHEIYGELYPATVGLAHRLGRIERGT